MKFLLATKDHMTELFGEDGTAYPVTVLKTEPLVVTQIKTVTRDGYSGVQVGYGIRKEKNVGKAVSTHMAKAGKVFAVLREFPLEGELKVGDTIAIPEFEEGAKVHVRGISKGKGFQGVVKRHGFHGGPRTHGQKHSEREPGSIGSTGPQRVFKGVRMAGRMGSDNITVRNVRVVRVDRESGELYLKGALPGRRGTVLSITQN